MRHPRESFERPPLPGAGYLENYTTAFLVSAGALLFVILFAIWALWGLPVALVAAFFANRAIPRT